MTQAKTKPRPVGRPKKAAGESFTHFIFARIRSDHEDKLDEIAQAIGFAGSGGRSAALRFAVDKVHALLFPKGQKK